MIRVTPIEGGQSLELPDETRCVRNNKRYEAGELSEVELSRNAIDARFRLPNGHLAVAEVLLLAHIARDAVQPDAFVHIGEAWPLCTVETWRERAERVERELAARNSLPWLTRLPTAEEVAAHARAYPCVLGGPYADGNVYGRWLGVRERAHLYELAAVEGNGGAAVSEWVGGIIGAFDAPCFAGTRWLPCTAEGIPVCLLGRSQS